MSELAVIVHDRLTAGYYLRTGMPHRTQTVRPMNGVGSWSTEWEARQEALEMGYTPAGECWNCSEIGTHWCPVMKMNSNFMAFFCDEHRPENDGYGITVHTFDLDVGGADD